MTLCSYAGHPEAPTRSGPKDLRHLISPPLSTPESSSVSLCLCASVANLFLPPSAPLGHRSLDPECLPSFLSSFLLSIFVLPSVSLCLCGQPLSSTLCAREPLGHQSVDLVRLPSFYLSSSSVSLCLCGQSSLQLLHPMIHLARGPRNAQPIAYRHHQLDRPLQ